ncbi:serine hydrolase domain-containing protein [Spirosoma spitsbergense]|uniref:serine hydrolase domain-containing protein n=1 Tax=Spirosoma spitsbergense TaxID=431554 RepID=UPI001FDFA020|nr:serine hydrolase domain-containing protein [Spirosoma spitsbergense]
MAKHPLSFSPPMNVPAWLCANLLLLLLAIGPVGTLRAQTVTPNRQPAELDQFITRLMDSARIPGLSMVVIRGNNIVYSKSYGLTKADSTQPVTPNTVFEAASLSKPVFAYAVMQLVEEKLLDLNKPLYEYLPYPDAAADARYQKITARMVLSHQSGFPNWRKDRKLPQLAMAYSPGKRFGYSGEGYVYLQKVVEKITDQPINEIMEFRVLKPLGMTNSSFVWQSDFNKHVAMPHNEAGEPEQKYQPGQANMAYSLHTTAEDYARFIRAIFTPAGLEPTTVNQMLTPTSKLPTRFSGDTLSTNLYWGLGFGLEEMSDATWFWHWGDNGAFKCFIMANRDRQDAVIYFTNSTNGLDIADRIVAKTLGGQHPAFPFLDINADEFFRKHPYKGK